jgi:F0F1-type ATP synthase membrane subunit c/vacuolar-type H+-ATPase subunit K
MFSLCSLPLPLLVSVSDSVKKRLCAVMAQILSIYGLVASVIISGQLVEKMALYTGFMQLAAGLSVGLCGLAAGFAIGVVGDAGGRSYAGCGKGYGWLTIKFCSASQQSAAQAIRRHGAHFDLCRGAGSVRCSCLHLDADEVGDGGDGMPVLRKWPAETNIWRPKRCSGPSFLKVIEYMGIYSSSLASYSAPRSVVTI